MFVFGSKLAERFTRLCLVLAGVALSIYSLHVKTTKLEDDSYTALCDINEKISCSAIFTSKWGRGFGIVHYFVGEDHFLNQSNSLYGIFYFLLQTLACFTEGRKLSQFLYWSTGFGIMSCMYLAYILAFILEDFCIVCVSTYFITISLHYLNYRAHKRNAGSKAKAE